LLVSFILLSQPYRLVRLAGRAFPMPLTEQVQGEIALASGACLLFLLAAADVLIQRRTEARAVAAR